VFLDFPVKSGTLRESTAHIPFLRRKSVRHAAHRAMFLCDLPPDSTDILHENYLHFSSNLSLHRTSSPTIIHEKQKKINSFETFFYWRFKRN
jgi:hypothetical protein